MKGWKKSLIALAAGICVSATTYCGIIPDVKGKLIEKPAAVAEQQHGLKPYHDIGLPERIKLDADDHSYWLDPILNKGSQILCYTEEKGSIIFSDEVEERTYSNQSDQSGKLKKTHNVLNIRPIDDDQTIYIYSKNVIKDIDFKKLTKKDYFSSSPKFSVDFKAPDIFSPEIQLSFYVEGRKIPHEIVDEGEFLFSVATPEYELNFNKLAKKGFIKKKDLKDKEVEIVFEANIILNKYERIPENKIGSLEDLKNLPEEYEQFLKKEISIPTNSEYMKKIVAETIKGKENVYDIIKACLDYTLDHIKYHDKELYLDPPEALQLGLGDCDDYTDIMITMLRIAGIPAKDGSGIYAGDSLNFGGHAWLEACIPLKDGGHRWVLIEPTFADQFYKNRYDYIQYKEKGHAYLFYPDIYISEMEDSLLVSSTVYNCGFKPGKEDLERILEKVNQ